LAKDEMFNVMGMGGHGSPTKYMEICSITTGSISSPVVVICR
jgi:hypothetical protein